TRRPFRPPARDRGGWSSRCRAREPRPRWPRLRRAARSRSTARDNCAAGSAARRAHRPRRRGARRWAPAPARPGPPAGRLARGALAVGRLDRRLRLLRRHVACDHDDRVVWRVEAPIESERVFTVELLDLVAPADHRPMIGMVEIERGGHLLAQARARIVAYP